MQDRYFDAVIMARRALTERITEFHVAAADGTPLALAEAGSHVELRFGGREGVFLRHYSLIGPVSAEGQSEPFWRIAVQREDRSRGSAFIHRAFVPGTKLRASRPVNGFRLRRSPAPSLLIAGGIGITPILSMARSLAARKQRFTAFYAGMERALMAYVDELQAFCGDGLTVWESASQGIPDLVAILSAHAPETQVYVCGPPALIEATVTAAAALGRDPDSVRFEVFNVAHRPEDQPFDVRLRDGRQVRVGAGTTILDALEAAGADTYADCRRGECGLCLTGVVGCDGALDHRDRVLGEAGHASGEQIALCCSRITGRLLDLDL
ncbi:MAG: oxidoreductase [Proteobacteria bacterium]|nr:oxidoreductase [Pseudomonadota bacterium]